MFMWKIIHIINRIRGQGIWVADIHAGHVAHAFIFHNVSTSQYTRLVFQCTCIDLCNLARHLLVSCNRRCMESRENAENAKNAKNEGPILEKEFRNVFRFFNKYIFTEEHRLPSESELLLSSADSADSTKLHSGKYSALALLTALCGDQSVRGECPRITNIFDIGVPFLMANGNED